MYRDPSEFHNDEEQLVCPKCNGSGKFYGRGYVENGTFKGHIGECYSCRGTGRQTQRDAHRCKTYWTKYARVPFN